MTQLLDQDPGQRDVGQDLRARLNLAGDGSAEADRLVAAAEADRRGAVARLEAQFPGCEIGLMGRRAGVESIRLLRDLAPDPRRTEMCQQLDHLLAAGDLPQTKVAFVEPETGLPRAIPDDLLRGPDAVRCLDPFIGAAALEASRTFVINNAQRSTGSWLHGMVLDLSTALRCRAKAHVFVSRGNAAGFGQHWDDQDVLLTQIAGRKHWEIRHPGEVAPLRSVVPQSSVGGVAWSGTLSSGDALVIPRGWAHTVGGFDGETSVHVTFGLTRLTALDVLAWLDGERLTRAGHLDGDNLEHAIGAWRSRLLTWSGTGPLAAGQAIDRDFAGVRFRVRLVGGPVFLPERCTSDDLVLRANRQVATVPRRWVELLAWLLEHPDSSTEEVRMAVPSCDQDLSEALTHLGRAGLLHMAAR